ncbi:MAG: peptidoglycan DD-metalloendopeptidase family protein [Treponema sp.]|nr:peptidoglycan DD-metalloendopeptidase family protein [Treponema sp.]
MKLNKSRITTLVLFLVFLAISVSDSIDAMSWPSEDAVLIRNFGVNNGGKPVLGIIFEGETNVLAAERGEIIFSRNKNDPASRLPSPLGAWTAVDHGDGLISIYCRYNDQSDLKNENQVNKELSIAVSGISGWSSREGFYFLLFDRRERRWINPAMIITPARETRPPQIISVTLRNEQGLVVQSNNLVQGRYTVVVNTTGGIPANLRTNPSVQYAPQRILCSINGAEVGSLNFEAVSARDGILMVSRNGLVPVKQIYANVPAYEAAEVFLPRGQARLEVIVQDINGNSSNIVSQLIVN